MTQLLPSDHPRTHPTASPSAGRPRLLLVCWFLLLAALAVAAPSAQEALGVPWGVVALVMFAPALASALLWVVARQVATWPCGCCRCPPRPACWW
ncbi:hypothetical protein GCM10028820_27710 [Tessaracoccus terricola]